MAKQWRITGAESSALAGREDADLLAHRQCGTGPMDFDRIVQRWSNRAALARSIRMQERRERRSGDWVPVVRLGDGEGY